MVNQLARCTVNVLGMLGLIITLKAQATEKLVFWHDRSWQALEVINGMSKSFTKKTGIPVEVIWVSSSDYKTMLLRHASEGDLPDVVLVPGDYVSFAKELKLSEVPETVQAKGIMKNALQGGLFEGRLMAAPVTWGNHLMLYYNRDLVKKPAQTFAELEQQAADLQAKNVKALGMSFGEMYWFAPFMGAFGGWPLDGQGALTLDTPATVQALDFYFNLAAKGLTDKDCRSDCAAERFVKGEFAYSIGGDWLFHDLEEKLGSKLGVTTLPTIDKRALTPMFSSYVLAFPNNGLSSPKRERLLKFMHYMQSPAVQRRWASEASLLPVNEKAFKAFTANANDNMKGSIEQLRFAKAMPNDRAMAYAWEGMAKGFSALFKGRANAEQAAALMQSHAEKNLKRDSP